MVARPNPRRLRAGFSLVELMLVMAIMLVLAVIALPRFLKVQQKAYEASVVSFLRTLQSGQESYRLANGFYADNFLDLGLLARGPAGLGEPFAPDDSSRLAALFSSLGPLSVHAAAPQQQQQQGQTTPPPKKRGGSRFGTRGENENRGSDAAPTGSGGPPSSGGSGSGRRRRGSGTPPSGGSSGGTGGVPSNSGASGGGTGGAASGQPGGQTPPSGAGSSGGAQAPSVGGPSTPTNLMVKHNYVFRLQRPTPTTWWCSVAPIRNRGESHFYFMDQTGVIRAELGKPANSASPQM